MKKKQAGTKTKTIKTLKMKDGESRKVRGGAVSSTTSASSTSIGSADSLTYKFTTGELKGK
ncbi:MAG: hypothetical protein ACREBK_01850 [Sphingomicrobium sp.]